MPEGSMVGQSWVSYISRYLSLILASFRCFNDLDDYEVPDTEPARKARLAKNLIAHSLELKDQQHRS